MKRHCFYAVLFLCWGLAAGTLSAEPVREIKSRPNILLIVADDLGIGDLRSFTPDTEAPAARASTLNIDALAAQGMRFSRFYTDSTCSASRAALLTGQHPARLGFHPVARGISPDVITLPDWLREQGYSTHHIGKWHIGELNAGAKPLAQGFDTSFGFLSQWFLQGPDAEGNKVLRQPVYQNPWLEDASQEKGVVEWQQFPGYLPDILTQRAKEEITMLATKEDPWFLWYATPLPHAPLHFPPGSQKTEGTDDDQYAAMIAHLDANVGSLVAALETSGQRDNTIIVFLSDNGAPEKRKGSNGGLSGGKARYSEGAVRTPMIWVDSSQTLPASLDQRAITIQDIFPTIAARIGVPLPFGTDGIDFASLNNIQVINNRMLYWMSRGEASVLSADKLWRIAEEWIFREKQGFNLSRIHSATTEDYSQYRYFYFQLVSGFRKDFLSWLEDVSRTAVKYSGNKITGNDFLRTPLKEWDFYIAVSPNVTSNEVSGEMVLAEQAGIWSMRYMPSQKILSINMHGHSWNVPFIMTTECTLIGLNADIYDRFTNISATLNPTELLLSVDGKELARTAWQIDSLADVDVSQPIWIGVSANNDKPWQGKISPPVLYHRANMVGEWPFLIDEKKLRTETCAQLQKQS